MFQISYVSCDVNHSHCFKPCLSTLLSLFHYPCFLMDLTFCCLRNCCVGIFYFIWLSLVCYWFFLYSSLLSFFVFLCQELMFSVWFSGQRTFFCRWQRFHCGKRSQASYIFSVLTSSAISPTSAGVRLDKCWNTGFWED